MRKSLLLLMLLLGWQSFTTYSQDLFSTPDTVCVRQPVYLVDSFTKPAESYYWGFCAGYLLNDPIGINSGPGSYLSTPLAVEVAKDDSLFYVFIATEGTTADSLYVLEYGNSLSNTDPDTVHLGTLNDVMPLETSKLFMMHVDGNWHLFVCGGNSIANSALVRLDFGTSLSNKPNIVNMDNHTGLLNHPKGLFIQEENNMYYGYVANQEDNKLLKLEFGDNISNTPDVIDLGAGFAFDSVSDMVHLVEEGEWYVFAVNRASDELVRLNYGTSIADTPKAFNLGNMDGRLFSPSSITFVRDCDNMHLFVTNSFTSDFVRYVLPAVEDPFIGATFSGFGNIGDPTHISRIIRDSDSIYAYVLNAATNSVTQVLFPQCQDATIQSSDLKNPPIYSYNQPGLYNVYLAVNEGKADMQVACKQIRVLPLPAMSISRDTFLCQGDTATLEAFSPEALSYTWSPLEAIDTFLVNKVKTFPEFTIAYHVVMDYANGCIVDTAILVEVSKNKADAGHDRGIADGARTILGGPMTTVGPEHTLVWTPNQFINDLSDPNPVVQPPYDYTYYLEVTNSDGCYDIDTVVVRVNCNAINLPNAFAPDAGNSYTNTFGIHNKNLIELNSFSIYDRWGQLVFTTTDVQEQWDGTVNGEPAPFGVYVWEADGFCAEGKRFKQSGNVTLIR